MVSPGCTDKDYIIAQYDGAVAYMDACMQNVFASWKHWESKMKPHVITSDTAKPCMTMIATLTTTVFMIARWLFPWCSFSRKLPGGKRFKDYCQLKDVKPTILEILGEVDIRSDGRSLMPLARGEYREPEPEFYITECTWMRKHGWRTPEWKLIHALEPDSLQARGRALQR